MNSRSSLQKGLGLGGSIIGVIVSLMNFALTNFYTISFIGILVSVCGIVFSCLYKSINIASSIILIICSIPLFIMHPFSIISAVLMASSGIIEKDRNKSAI